MTYDQKKVDAELDRLESRLEISEDRLELAEKRLAEASALLNSWMLSTPPLRGARPVQKTRDFLSATPSPAAEPALREVAVELEKAKAKIGRIVDGGIVLSRAGIELEQHLIKAMALLRRWMQDEDHAEDGSVRSETGRFLSGTPSHPAEPAPSLVEQIDAAIKVLDHGTWAFDGLVNRALTILRAAREAGGR